MKGTSHKLLNFENYTLHTIKFISTTGAQKSKNLGFEHFFLRDEGVENIVVGGMKIFNVLTGHRNISLHFWEV